MLITGDTGGQVFSTWSPAVGVAFGVCKGLPVPDAMGSSASQGVAGGGGVPWARVRNHVPTAFPRALWGQPLVFLSHFLQP